MLIFLLKQHKQQHILTINKLNTQESFQQSKVLYDHLDDANFYFIMRFSISIMRQRVYKGKRIKYEE